MNKSISMDKTGNKAIKESVAFKITVSYLTTSQLLQNLQLLVKAVI